MLSIFTINALLISTILQLSSSQTVAPDSVDGNTKAKWCSDQKSTCPLLCLQIPGASKTPTKNDCDPTSLVYTCLCSNGQQPNSSEYSLTIPYHECQEFGNQCVKNCGTTDSACQTACRTNNLCGAQNPVRINTSSITTSSSTATSAGTNAASTSAENPADYTGFGAPTSTPSSGSGSGSGSSGSNGAQALAIRFGRTYGLALVLAMVCGGFTFML